MLNFLIFTSFNDIFHNLFHWRSYLLKISFLKRVYFLSGSIMEYTCLTYSLPLRLNQNLYKIQIESTFFFYYTDRLFSFSKCRCVCVWGGDCLICQNKLARPQIKLHISKCVWEVFIVHLNWVIWFLIDFNFVVHYQGFFCSASVGLPKRLGDKFV